MYMRYTALHRRRTAQAEKCKSMDKADRRNPAHCVSFCRGGNHGHEVIAYLWDMRHQQGLHVAP